MPIQDPASIPLSSCSSQASYIVKGTKAYRLVGRPFGPWTRLAYHLVVALVGIWLAYHLVVALTSFRALVIGARLAYHLVVALARLLNLDKIPLRDTYPGPGSSIS